jgi:hypothetical protein
VRKNFQTVSLGTPVNKGKKKGRESGQADEA